MPSFIFATLAPITLVSVGLFVTSMSLSSQPHTSPYFTTKPPIVNCIKSSQDPALSPPPSKKLKTNSPPTAVIQISLPPIIGPIPHTLILGSFPSEKSQTTYEAMLEESCRKGASFDTARFEAAKYRFLRGGDGKVRCVLLQCTCCCWDHTYRSACLCNDEKP